MSEVYSILRGSGPPTKDTPGAVGQKYVDTNTGAMYECTEAFSNKGYKFSRENYTWKKKGYDMDSFSMDSEVSEYTEGYVFAELID